MKSVDGSLNALRTDYIEVNAVHRAAPNAAIAFNTRPEDTAEAAARWLRVD